MNTSEVNFVHCMRMIAFLTNLNAVGMDQTGKFNSSLYVLKTFLCHLLQSNIGMTSVGIRPMYSNPVV